jgi:predicted nucleic acid-binding protein
MELVDTSVWIEYMERVNSLVEREMEMLLRTGEVATAGLVLAELRRGCRTPNQAKRMLSRLQGLPYVEVDRDNWLAAGQMVAEAAARGYKLEMANCLLAALALRDDCLALTLDRDFQRIPGLRLYPLRTV